MKCEIFIEIKKFKSASLNSFQRIYSIFPYIIFQANSSTYPVDDYFVSETTIKLN